MLLWVVPGRTIKRTLFYLFIVISCYVYKIANNLLGSRWFSHHTFLHTLSLTFLAIFTFIRLVCVRLYASPLLQKVILLLLLLRLLLSKGCLVRCVLLLWYCGKLLLRCFHLYGGTVVLNVRILKLNLTGRLSCSFANLELFLIVLLIWIGFRGFWLSLLICQTRRDCSLNLCLFTHHTISRVKSAATNLTTSSR